MRLNQLKQPKNRTNTSLTGIEKRVGFKLEAENGRAETKKREPRERH